MAKPRQIHLPTKFQPLVGPLPIPPSSCPQTNCQQLWDKGPRPYLCSHWVFRISLTLTSMARKDDATVLENLSLFSWRTFLIGSSVKEHNLVSITAKVPHRYWKDTCHQWMEKICPCRAYLPPLFQPRISVAPTLTGSWIVGLQCLDITYKTWRRELDKTYKKDINHCVISLLDGIYKVWI